MGIKYEAVWRWILSRQGYELLMTSVSQAAARVANVSLQSSHTVCRFVWPGRNRSMLWAYMLPDRRGVVPELCLLFLCLSFFSPFFFFYLSGL
ncbi:hypothetical protein IF1G_03331 [Cordyceps javanica]|uniref:Uncharacterized protein n=1 Tax=Cordyceps javanica TaxID=43265 RepID=A0A545V7A2_9HYPO|nr:hypothetical protein IF1G_03331 [Cordyceps javanica]